MSNLCTVQKPAALTASWWQYNTGSVGSPTYFQSNMANALTVPWVFDADVYGITCVAFANNASSGTLLSYQTQINTLQTTVSNLNTQLQALTAGSQVVAPNPEILQAEGIIFGVALATAAVIYGLKRVYNLFKSDPSEA